MPALIWLPMYIRKLCYEDADRHYPVESGGAFMGYEAKGAIVITAMIPGGVNACRTPVSFEPDRAWQNCQIANHYERSGRLDTYLGDWHSHPNTRRGYLSRHDRTVLKKIIRDPGARTPQPISVVLAGVAGEWLPSAWRGALNRRRILLDQLRIEPMDVRIF